MSEDAAVVLAAGKGTRMHSRLPKVLHLLAGKPMLARVLNSLRAAGFDRPTVVVGYGADQIRAAVGDRCQYVEQTEQRGTGDAARVGLEVLPSHIDRVLLVHGDDPMVPPGTYRDMLDKAAETGAPIVLLTARVDDTRSLGRVVRNAWSNPVALVQESELTAEQRSLNEINLGAYVFDAGFLRRHLGALTPHPPKGEYYLTDLVAVAAREAESGGPPVASVTLDGGNSVLGVNDLVQLEAASRSVRAQTNRTLMERGVTIVDSASTFIDDDAQIEPGAVIRPFTIIEGSTRIGSGCVIGPNAHIVSSILHGNCTVLASTLEHAEVEAGVSIGPYAHLRPGARIGAGAEIGNYAEIKASTIGAGTRIHHFSYVGDADVGENVNIGAGVITCNYDGVAKHQTNIGNGAFVGSDTMLLAPVTVGKGAVTGAGSVVTRDVPPGSTVAGIPARIMDRRTHESNEQSEDVAVSPRRRGS